MFQQSTLKFLSNLAKNNNKLWLDANRESYIVAKTDFENFVSLLIKKITAFDEDITELQAKDCTFRLNRDIRFSKDKTPYKVNMGASLNKGGKKSIYAGYYFHLEPGNKSFIGGGLWMPMPSELKKVRQEIDYNFDKFKDVVTNKNFITHYKELEATNDVKLTNIPREYEKTNPAAEYLKLKSFIATKPLMDAELTSSSLLNNSEKAFKALLPLVNFLNRAIE
jgi:uncharacterized protein (TIGR02453 family)